MEVGVVEIAGAGVDGVADIGSVCIGSSNAGGTWNINIDRIGVIGVGGLARFSEDLSGNI